MAVKKTGVNKGIQKGVDTEQFQDKVICKKCGKEITFTLESQLFLKCPRCKAKVERNLKQEHKQAKKIIKWDILRRSKKAILTFGFFLTLASLIYNVVGFFTGLFEDSKWWLALVSLPLVIFAYFCMRKTKNQSASKKYKFYASLALIINFVALGVIVITACPWLTEQLSDLFNI